MYLFILISNNLEFIEHPYESREMAPTCKFSRRNGLFAAAVAPAAIVLTTKGPTGSSVRCLFPEKNLCFCDKLLTSYNASLQGQ
jgi:hypothetical protein